MVKLSTPIDFSGFIIPPPPPPRVNLSPSAHTNNNQSKFVQATSKPKHEFDPKFELSAPRATKNVDSSNDVAPTSSYSTLQKVSFTDRELQEIRVAKETFFKEPKDKISPRIASIQKMLAGSTSQVSLNKKNCWNVEIDSHWCSTRKLSPS